MYSDDIWNSVITSRSHNSMKSNTIPSEEVITKLNYRNRDLINIIDNEYMKKELKFAIENNYVNKFYKPLKCYD